MLIVGINVCYVPDIGFEPNALQGKRISALD